MDFEERMLAHLLAEVDAAHGAALAEHFGVKVVVPTVLAGCATRRRSNVVTSRAEVPVVVTPRGGMAPRGSRCYPF